MLLCGCGAQDGSDPHEVVLLLLAIQRAGFLCIPMALDREGRFAADPLTGAESVAEPRNQLRESARLINGKIYSLDEISPKILDALIIPGGQGVLKNLFLDPSKDQQPCVLPEVASFVSEVHSNAIPIAALSLAEFVLSGTLGLFSNHKSILDILPDEILEDNERKLLLAQGNISAVGLPQLERCTEALVARLSAYLK
jgi:enhancing lycopene biosynthesis protein 2